MNPRVLRRLHRWFGIVFCLSALLSSGSGVIHTIMARTQPPPPPATPAGAVRFEGLLLSPKSAVQALLKGQDGVIQSINIRSIEGQPWYQVLIEGHKIPVYVNGSSGHVDEGMDEVYARQIASQALGGAEVVKTAYLTDYNREYLNIFRLLPVYRFDANDGKGTRLYVSTLTGSVARHTDNRRQLEANIFSNFHKLAFIENRLLRDLVLTTVTFGIFIASLMGLVLFTFTLRR